MKNPFLSVQGEAFSEIVIEKSRFIGSCRRCENEESARSFIDETKKKYPFATHNVYAFICSEDGNLARFSDDGEPQGTAGQPVLEVLKNKNLRNTALVVTRYFGGIKLGAGGLVRAYSRSAAETINNAKIVSSEYSEEFSAEMSYEQYQKFFSFCEGKKIVVLKSEFEVNVRLKLVLPCVLHEKYISELIDYYNGKCNAIKCGEYYYEYDKGEIK